MGNLAPLQLTHLEYQRLQYGIHDALTSFWRDCGGLKVSVTDLGQLAQVAVQAIAVQVTEEK